MGVGVGIAWGQVMVQVRVRVNDCCRGLLHPRQGAGAV